MSQCLSGAGSYYSNTMRESTVSSNIDWETAIRGLSEMETDIVCDDAKTEELRKRQIPLPTTKTVSFYFGEDKRIASIQQNKFNLMPWMAEEMEEIRKSNLLMKANIVKMYKIILALEKALEKTTSRTERANLVEIIHKMEEYCQGYLSSIIYINEENVEAIEEMIQSTSTNINEAKESREDTHNYVKLPATIKLIPWMTSQIEQIDGSVRRVKEKTILLYKQIMAAETARAVSKSRSERELLASDIQEWEKLSGNVAAATRVINNKNIWHIEGFLESFNRDCDCPNRCCLGEYVF